MSPGMLGSISIFDGVMGGGTSAETRDFLSLTQRMEGLVKRFLVKIALNEKCLPNSQDA